MTGIWSLKFCVRSTMRLKKLSSAWIDRRRKNMQAQNIKVEAHALVDNLSDDASWDDLMQNIYVRQAIESGLADSRADRGSTVQAVHKKYRVSL